MKESFEIDKAQEALQLSEDDVEKKKSCPFPVQCCGNKLMLLKVDDATGFQCFRFANGAVIMSNVFLSSALITLAEREAGCVEGDSKCMGQVYGFRPSSFITIIATISGLMSAFLLPLIGAIVDYTKYRKLLGGVMATLIIIVQAVQIGTVQSTWFAMAILQAINGFFYQALTLCAYAYLPDIKRVVGEATMTVYSSRFYMWMFLTEAVYLIIVIGISLALNGDDVFTGQLGQGVDVAVSGFFYILGFYFFTPKGPRRVLPEGNSLIFAGFKQVCITTKGIFQHYPNTLGWFLLGVLFAESAVNSFTTVSVTFLNELGLSSTMTGLVFLEVLVSTLPGSAFATYLMNKTKCPIKGMKLNLIVFIIINFVAFLLLGDPSRKNLVWIFGALWGFMLGWFYPTELHLFSSLMPKGQEAELAGFYLYCTQVLGWLPPLVFTIFNEDPNIDISWGGVQLNIWIFISLICYFCMPAWDVCCEITNADNKIVAAKESARV